MSFTYATQPELIRSSQKDSEIINSIYEQLYSILEHVIPVRQIYNHINTLKTISNLSYYLLTYLQEKRTIGEEYTNIQAFNYSDYDNEYVPILRKRRILFIIYQFISFSFSKLRQRQIMTQQQNQQSFVCYFPDLNNIIDSIQEFHLALFLIHGSYFEISKRLTSTQYIFTRIPPKHNIQYKRIGQAYLILLFFQFLKFIKDQYQIYLQNKMKKIINKERGIQQDQQNNDQLTQCLVCYDNATNITCTPCGHLYCWDCIMQQVIMKQQCPICRSQCQPQQLVQLNNYN